MYIGLREMADDFQTAIAGGDTNSWNGPLAISVTVIGEPTGMGPVRRTGAKPGDWILLTGPLGGSIAGKHLTFTPRVREAQQLHGLVELHAMIDISDGLAADLNHLCSESGCGAVLFAEAIPIADAACALGDGKSALDHALSDGEDFELIFIVSPNEARDLIEKQPISGVNLTQIGACVERGLWIEMNGQRRPLKPEGYVHLFG
jgi:thiamine-monophosphate kinase